MRAATLVRNLRYRLPWTIASAFPLLFFLASVAGQDRQDCRVRFHDCYRPNGSMEWSMECDVVLRQSTKKLRVCGKGITQIIRLDSDAGKRYDSYCDIETCTIRSSWCPWGAWSERKHSCGIYEKLHRRRQKCCHPISDERIKCARRTYAVRRKEKERKSVHRIPCQETNTNTDDGDLTNPDNSYTTNIIISCSVGLIVIIIIVLCRCSRNLRNRNRAQTRRPASPPSANAPSSRPTAPPATASAPLMLPENPPPIRVEPGRVIRAPTPPPAYGAPPAYNSAWRNDSTDPESPPPQYEAALRLTT